MARQQLVAANVPVDEYSRRIPTVAVLNFDPTTGSPINTGGASGTTPVTGTFTASGNSAVFVAQPGRAVWVKLNGTFSATITVQRCSDGTATTAQAITVGGASYAVFTAPCQEAVSSEDDTGVGYLLNCAWTSGTVNYQLGHK
jgi:hypothetical protein